MKIAIDINKKYKDLELIVQSPELNEEVTALVSKLEEKNKMTFTGKLKDDIYILDTEEINMFYSQSGKVYADCHDAAYEISQKLYEIESLLAHTSFVRISKSAIVNIYKMKKIEVAFNGSLLVKFENAKEEIISRRYVKKVKEFIGLGGKS